MFLRKGLLFFVFFGLLIFAGQATAGSNANAVLSLDLIADGGVGNQIDDGVTSGTVSGQGTKIAVEVFAKGVTTSLTGMRLEFDFDASVLTYVGAENSVFLFKIPHGAIGTNLAPTKPVTLPSSGFLARAEFTTAVDVTGESFSIGIKRVLLADSRTSSDSLTTTEVIRFNAAPSSDTPPSPDFDGDGMVGIPDFLLFVDRFGSMRGDGRYEAKYDLDENGVIGVPDFLIFVEDFGKEVPSSDRGSDEEIVSIPDANLRAVVEDSLGKARGAPIYRDEMATLTRLIARNANISDLTGLEFATGLQLLGFINTSIVDLSPLSNLTNLTGLFLNSTSIVDISPLSNLTNLAVLFLNSTSIVDISPLSNLTNLTGLDLSSTSIVDISPLSGLTNLSLLGLEENSISDVSALSGLTSLERLRLQGNTISDVSALSGLTNLTSLTLSGNRISDLSPLVANTGLGSGDEVNVRFNPLSATSVNTHIPALQGRGVTVQF